MSLKNKIVKSNYHTHTYLCRHAIGNVEDYVKKAIKFGIKQLGFSDHAPFSFLEDRSVRMDLEDYPTYMKELDEAIKKYDSQIKIYKGLEIEYFSFKKSHYKNLLKELDYLILGQHYIQRKDTLKSIYKVDCLEDMKIYCDTVIEAMNTKDFKIFAHPDIFLFNQIEFTKEIEEISVAIINAAEENNVALEINANGFRKGKFFINEEERYKYPRKEFWDLVKSSNAKVVISSDAHKPKHLLDEAIYSADKFSTDIGIEVEEELVMS